MSDIFTPLNEARTERLKIPKSNIKVLRGTIGQRERGYHATIEIKGKQYKVYGISCGLPGCHCDAYIKEVREAA